MEYKPTFFMQITDAFLVRTEPASSMVKPAHIHITSAPHTRNEKVLATNCASSPKPAAALAANSAAAKAASAAAPARSAQGADWTDSSTGLPFHLPWLTPCLDRLLDGLFHDSPQVEIRHCQSRQVKHGGLGSDSPAN